jgi:ferredoxin
MLTLTIDGRQVEVEAGQTVLAAGQKLGIDIPTLCYSKQCAPATSCLVCLVKLNAGGQGRLVPACATKAAPGMAVESETPEVHAARRTALELLLSDHVGDCLSPCHRICPLHLNIPVMLRQLQANRPDLAIATVKEALPLPAVLGRLCHAPCENGCRRGTYDQPVAIRDLVRYTAAGDLAREEPYLPPRKPASGKSVAIVGAGPTGLAAAYFLLREGHACALFDRHAQPGGALRSQVDPLALPPAVLDAEIAQLKRLGAQFKPGTELGREVSLESLAGEFDAVLLALGEHAKAQAPNLGLAVTPAGIRVEPETGLTSQPKLFAAGSAVKPAKQLVRALAEGRNAAAGIHQFLSGQRIQRPDKQFSSMMGRLLDGELPLFMAGANPAPRVAPASNTAAGLNAEQASAEAGRCLHCDCRAAGNCKLQHYAELYGAEPNRFREQRRRFEQQLQHSQVIFEPGKCILCGICVQLSEQAREPLGLTFIGRGFEVRVGAPLNHTIADGLQKAAAQCVEHCPTGALAFKDTAARL